MRKLLTCEILELGRIFNEGIWIKPDVLSEPVFYDFGGLNFKQIHIGNDESGVWFMAYNHMIKLEDKDKTWWFSYDKCLVDGALVNYEEIFE